MTITRDKLLELAKKAGATLYADTILVNGRDADDFVERFAALLSEAQEGEPSGYAYRYPSFDGSVIRFNNGHEVNGGRPIEAIPYWFAPPSSDQVWNEQAEAMAKMLAKQKRFMEADAIRSLKRPSQAQEPRKADGTFVHCGDSHQSPYAASGAVGEQSAQVTDEQIQKLITEHENGLGFILDPLAFAKSLLALSRVQAAPEKKPDETTVEFWLGRGLTQEAAECEAAYRKNRSAIKDAFAKTRFAAPSVNEQGGGK